MHFGLIFHFWSLWSNQNMLLDTWETLVRLKWKCFVSSFLVLFIILFDCSSVLNFHRGLVLQNLPTIVIFLLTTSSLYGWISSVKWNFSVLWQKYPSRRNIRSCLFFWNLVIKCQFHALNNPLYGVGMPFLLWQQWEDVLFNKTLFVDSLFVWWCVNDEIDFDDCSI
jgi:hypothetical protein